MQLYAYSKTGSCIAANQAVTQQDYSCLECGGVVRRRGGKHRQPHYFHLNPTPHCRLGNKSLTHIQVQKYIQTLYNKSFLEYSFPEIRRIADVYCPEHKLVFEVQCSPISYEEIAGRNGDYASLGIQVVWVLHNKRFHQVRVSAAEDFLLNHPHYFTNMTPNGEGCIYDVYYRSRGGIRLDEWGNSIVDLGRPKERIGYLFRERWRVHFEGDLIDQGFACPGEEEEERVEKKSVFGKICRGYHIIFQMLLESYCRR